MDTFQNLWQRFHPDAVPVGGTLERDGTWNLTRFHLLPNSRDSAVSRAEFRSLIDRFNILATEVLGEDQPIWLILPHRAAPDWAPTLAQTEAERARVRRLKSRYGLKTQWEYYDATEKCIFQIEAAPLNWRQRTFDRLFLQVYHEALRDAVFMNASTGAIVVPYIAGAYVSQPTPEALIALIGQYYGWLPTDGSGLLRFNPAQMSGPNFQVSKACAAAIQRAVG